MAAQAGLCLAWSETPEDTFSYDEAQLSKFLSYNICTVMVLSFRTDIPGQTVQTQIRQFLEEQSDQGLQCLPFRLHPLDSLLYGRAT